jgi:phage terminase large subunit-like protein
MISIGNSLEKVKGNPVLVDCGVHCDKWRLPYDDILKDLSFMRVHNYDAFLDSLRQICETDFFFFCIFILNLPINHPFLLARAYEVQDMAFENAMYLWARGSWKSTLITFARTLWKFCKAPDNTVFLFSNSLKLIRPHFKLLKKEMESNIKLKTIWPDVFWADPEKEADWTLNEGLFLRQNKLKDPSLAGYGLIDAMPTGGHPKERIVDDLVDLKNIGTEFMMDKVMEAYRLSDNLSSGGDTKETIIGTRYTDGDLYELIEREGQHSISIRPAEVDELGEGLYDGIPVYLSSEVLAEKKIKQKNIYHAQMLLKPYGKGFSILDVADLRFYDDLPDVLNYYIVGDPAVNPKYTTYKDKDKTALFLLGAGAGRRIYIVDFIHEEIGLKEKWEQLKLWHDRYDVDITAYEEYGTQKDREFFELKMDEERFYFKITPIKGDQSSKPDRIRRLSEFFTEKKIFFPRTLVRLTKNRGVVDLVTDFIENEYRKYPNVKHEDRLDALSIFTKLDIIYPEGSLDDEVSGDYRVRYRHDPLDEEENYAECYFGGY